MLPTPKLKHKNALEVFYSYSHKDEKLKDGLVTHLSILKRQGLIASWHDREISSGKEWANEINIYLNAAHIIVLLISPDFLASDYCYSVEMKRAMERHEIGEARVIPVILRPVDWEHTPFSTLQTLPKDAKPVTEWPNRDKAFLDVARGIRAVVEELTMAFSINSSPIDTQLGSSEKKSAFPHLWNVPYQPNPLFTGRKEVLKRLYDLLRMGTARFLTQPVAISGLGGMGKTQIAIEYAYRYRDTYQAVLWAKADSRETLASDFAALAEVMNLLEKDDQDRSRIVEVLKGWLKNHYNWLFILDNADDLNMVRDFIPIEGQGHVLLTTRAQAMGRIALKVELEKMEPEEGALFLLRRADIIASDASLDKASIADRQKAKKIVQALGGLPLALDQAGAYIEDTACGLTNYLDIYQRQQTILLKRRGGFVSDHPEPVATTWSLSFEKVEQANPAAAELIRFCAFLYPEEIPEEIITMGASDFGPTLQPVASEPNKLNETVGELLKYSLVQRNPDRTLTIHRLMQVVLKDGMNKRTKRRWAERAVRAVERVFPDAEFTTWSLCQRYLPHAQACTALIAQWEMNFVEATRLLSKLGSYLYDLALFPEAESLYKQALIISEKTLGSEHLDVATRLNDLALSYYAQARYAEAEPLYQRALEIGEKTLAPDDLKMATRHENLAILYYAQARYAEAEPLYQRALEIGEKTLGPEHPKVATNLNNLALLYDAQGKYAEAESLLQRALTINIKALGPDDPSIATNLNNLALLYDARGKYAEAEPLLQRALTINEKTLGLEHPEVAINLNNLALLYDAQGKYAEAESLLQRALTINIKALGSEHPEVATNLNNLALLYDAQGKYAEAEPLLQRALTISEKTLGSEHPEVATVLESSAALLRKMNRKAETSKLNARAK